MSKAGDKIIAGLQEAVIIAPYLATIERQREALRVAREALAPFVGTEARVTPNRGIYDMLVKHTEVVAAKDAIAAIDAALKEDGE